MNQSIHRPYADPFLQCELCRPLSWGQKPDEFRAPAPASVYGHSSNVEPPESYCTNCGTRGRYRRPPAACQQRKATTSTELKWTLAWKQTQWLSILSECLLLLRLTKKVVVQFVCSLLICPGAASPEVHPTPTHFLEPAHIRISQEWKK